MLWSTSPHVWKMVKNKVSSEGRTNAWLWVFHCLLRHHKGVISKTSKRSGLLSFQGASLTVHKKNANTYDQSISNLSCSSPWLFTPMEDNKSNKSEMPDDCFRNFTSFSILERFLCLFLDYSTWLCMKGNWKLAIKNHRDSEFVTWCQRQLLGHADVTNSQFTSWSWPPDEAHDRLKDKTAGTQ